MDFLSGSGLILLVCVLVGLGLVARRRKTSVTSIGAEKFVADIVESHVSEAEAPRALAAPQHQVAVESLPAFRLKPGRVALFGLALLFAFAALVTGALALWGTGAAFLPLIFLLASLACLGSLRVLALRDRNRRRARTVLAVEQRQAQVRPASPQKTSSGPVNLSSQASTGVSAVEVKPAPERPARARQQIPVSHAAKALRKAKTQHHPVIATSAPVADSESTAQQAPTRLRMDEALPDTSWQVTEVPLPTYLEAETVRREAPAPVETETAPRSQSQTLAQAATLNLDDVLKRRRA
ncbi:MAG: hypothetical protein Q4A03_08805 [Rothia sp. (in: high G+C Gram-positive bacteria)]|uniref:hypothetical protein n=1 Tax=Rothia sp. (in: high G+C Gram-positive bacteria) TaxID=1885016 RepID=UPI0026FBF695|nr:hypothetical protein [Rothia sp. (in: high G+C Gram-positive bacteria)]